MLWMDLETLPAVKYASWEIMSKPHKVFECRIERIEPGLKPRKIVGLCLYGENPPRFLVCMSDKNGNYYLEITEPPKWSFAEVSD
jgi:hypothetical protein